MQQLKGPGAEVEGGAGAAGSLEAEDVEEVCLLSEAIACWLCFQLAVRPGSSSLKSPVITGLPLCSAYTYTIVTVKTILQLVAQKVRS